MIELLGGKKIYDNLSTYRIGNINNHNSITSITPESMSHSIMKATQEGESPGNCRILVRMKVGKGQPLVSSYFLSKLASNWSVKNVLYVGICTPYLLNVNTIHSQTLSNIKDLLTTGKNSIGETLV